jgi:ABC-type arginine transport system permease subunit
LSFTDIQPIPSSNIVTVAFETPTTQKVNLTLHDISGRIVLQKTIDATQGITATQIDISNFAAGIYTLSMSDANSIVVEKIVKK